MIQNTLTKSKKKQNELNEKNIKELPTAAR